MRILDVLKENALDARQYSVDEIRTMIGKAYDMKRSLASRAAANRQSPTAYNAETKRLDNAIKVLTHKLDVAKKREQSGERDDAEKRAFHNRIAARSADPEQRKERFRKAVSDSQKQRFSEYSGNRDALMRDVADYLEAGIEDGGRPNLDSAAEKFGKTRRTVSKWLEHGQPLYNLALKGDYPNLRGYVLDKR